MGNPRTWSGSTKAVGRTGVSSRFILDGDWTFVTSNAVDFRGPADRPGSRGQYADVVIHAGLICLGGPAGGVTLDDQVALFEIASMRSARAIS